MRLDLTGRNVDITPALRQLLVRKLARLERLLQDSAVSAQVVLRQERYRHITDVTVHARGDHVLAGVAAAASWPESMSAALEKITQQAQRLKEKWTARKRRAAAPRQLPVGPARAQAVPSPPAARRPVVNPVRYAIRRHTLQAAVTRLDRTREPFVLFRHADSLRLNVVFRQADGTLALIEPEA
jgi:putative sigma-54 modulation protein